MKGTLHLIPTTLGDVEPDSVIPVAVLEVIQGISIFVVEEVRSARRFLSRAGLRGKIGELTFMTLNEHTTPEELSDLIAPLKNGEDVALLSEAGLPAVADPGADLVALAHMNAIKVIPYVGPSSLMLALMASGLNGQSFAFCGYVSAKRDERVKKIKELERRSGDLNQTQIIIETPYRNDQLFGDILNVCNVKTRVCVASDLTLETSEIITKSVEQWRKSGLVIGKKPAVFLLLA